MKLSQRKRRIKNERPTTDVCLKDGMQNAAQTLLANIRFSSVDKPMRIIAITSSIPNEGKTTVTLSLALAISRSGAKCLIVEGDMRRRSMKTLLGARPRYGLHRLLTGKCSFKEAIVSTNYDNIFFLDAEQGIPNPDSILSSGQFEKMLESLRSYYHYVLIDTPPVSAFVDAAIVASKADGTLLVTREGYTNKNEVVRAAEQLRTADANVLGLVMNGHQSGTSGYGGHYYDYYYEYYSDNDSTAPRVSPNSTLGKLRDRVSLAGEAMGAHQADSQANSQAKEPEPHEAPLHETALPDAAPDAQLDHIELADLPDEISADADTPHSMPADSSDAPAHTTTTDAGVKNAVTEAEELARVAQRIQESASQDTSVIQARKQAREESQSATAAKHDSTPPTSVRTGYKTPIINMPKATDGTRESARSTSSSREERSAGNRARDAAAAADAAEDETIRATEPTVRPLVTPSPLKTSQKRPSVFQMREVDED